MSAGGAIPDRAAKFADGNRRARRRPSELDDRLADATVVSDSFLRPSFTIDQIRTFLAVAAREHVTHAARVLRLSQPAVTQQVQLFERALGVRLLERVGRNVRLTTAGVEVAGSCLLIMRAMENLEKVVQAMRGLERGSVTIGASEIAASYYLPPRLSEFATAHPGINLGVVVAEAEEICQGVAAGHFECGLVDGTSDNDLNLLQVEVATTDVLVVANPDHPHAGRTDRLDELLDGSQFLIWGPGSATEDLASQWLGGYIEGIPQVLIGSLEAARRAVLHSSTFLAAMPSIAVADDVKSGALVSMPVPGDPLPLSAVRRRGPESPGVEAIWQTLLRRRDE